MGTMIGDFVAKLSDNEKMDIISSYEQFEADGQIGMAPCREQALRLIQEAGLVQTGASITTWMRDVSRECYIHFARKYFEIATSEEI